LGVRALIGWMLQQYGAASWLARKPDANAARELSSI
jgi:hypothetical protein